MSTAKRSGGKRLKDEGKSLIWVALNTEQKKLVRIAAASEGLPMSEFVRKYGLKAAERAVKRISAKAS